MSEDRLLRRTLSATNPAGEASALTIELDWRRVERAPLRGVARLSHGDRVREIRLVHDDEWGLILEGTFVIRVYLERWARDEGFELSWGGGESLFLTTEPRGYRTRDGLDVG